MKMLSIAWRQGVRAMVLMLSQHQTRARDVRSGSYAPKDRRRWVSVLWIVPMQVHDGPALRKGTNLDVWVCEIGCFVRIRRVAGVFQGVVVVRRDDVSKATDE